MNKMSKSIIIIGKGPSVLKSTKEFVDSFDEVAICNRPLYEGYEEYISDHADYDFCTNLQTVRQYTLEFIEKLGIKKTIATGLNSALRNNFEYKNLDPSTGILAFFYFLIQEEYSHICLVGFDLFEKNKKMYYFKPEELTSSLVYLYHNNTFSKDLVHLLDSGHNLELSFEFIVESFKKNKNKKFTIVSNFEGFDVCKNLENVHII